MISGGLNGGFAYVLGAAWGALISIAAYGMINGAFASIGAAFAIGTLAPLTAFALGLLIPLLFVLAMVTAYTIYSNLDDMEVLGCALGSLVAGASLGLSKALSNAAKPVIKKLSDEISWLFTTATGASVVGTWGSCL